MITKRYLRPVKWKLERNKSAVTSHAFSEVDISSLFAQSNQSILCIRRADRCTLTLFEHGMTDPLTVSVSSSRLAGGAGLEAARGCAAWGAKTGFWSAGTLSTDGGDRGGKGEQ